MENTLVLLDGYRLQSGGGLRGNFRWLYRRRLLNSLRRLTGTKLRIIVDNSEAVSHLNTVLTGVPVTSITSHLGASDTEEVTGEAALLATGWFKDKRHDNPERLFEYDGLSVLEANYEWLVLYFIESLNTITVLEALISEERPDRVILEHPAVMKGIGNALVDQCPWIARESIFPAWVEQGLSRVTQIMERRWHKLPLETCGSPAENLNLSDAILFAPQSPSGLGTYVPTARKLVEGNGQGVCFLLWQAWGKGLESQLPGSSEAFFLEDFVPRDIGKKVAQAVAYVHPRAMKSLGKMAEIRHKGIALQMGFANWLRRALPAMLHESLFYFFVYKEMLGAVRPVCVVVSSDQHPRGYALVRAAGQRGIPTVRIDGGNIGEALFRHVAKVRSVSPGKAIEWKLSVDRLGVETPAVKAKLCSLGIDNQQVESIGFPRLDQVCLAHDEAKAANRVLMSEFDIRPFDKVLLYAVLRPWNYVGCTSQTRIWFLQNLIEVLSDLENVFLLVKPHPSDTSVDSGQVEALMQSLNVRGKVAEPWRPGPQLVTLADLTIAATSALVLESVILGRPVLIEAFSWQPGVPGVTGSLNSPKWSLSYRFQKAGLMQVVSDKATLSERIRQFLYNKEFIAEWQRKREALLEQEVLPVDGTSSARAALLIRGALDSRKRVGDSQKIDPGQTSAAYSQ